MRIYQNKDKTRDIQCNYCYEMGHNKRHCPTMKAHWEANPQVHETYDHDNVVGVDKTMFPQSYQTHWGDNSAKIQFRAHWNYMKNRFAEKPKTTKSRAKAKCGFCGSTAHNRRNCNKMKNFVYVLNETNRAYRSQFYDRFIEGMGIGAGALVQTKTWEGEEVGIMVDFPTDKIMFTNLKRSWSDFYTAAKGKILVNGETFAISIANDFMYDPDYYNSNYGVWTPMHSPYGRIVSVISPAPNRPSKEWFLGQEPCFQWVVKKRDQRALMSELSLYIKEFYPHDNLKAKLGAKCYDLFYT